VDSNDGTNDMAQALSEHRRMMLLAIGPRIADLRAGIGLKSEELADAVGTNRGTVSGWENGHNLPDTKFLLPLAQVLRVTVDELLTGDFKPQTTLSEEDPVPPPDYVWAEVRRAHIRLDELGRRLASAVELAGRADIESLVSGATPPGKAKRSRPASQGQKAQ
jgi:transcriptional regulator with XRE-family HTH domain